MEGIIYALVTILAWGAWLAPSQNVTYKNQQIKTMYVALGNLILATVVIFIVGFEKITSQVFWLPFIGGLIWSVSAWCAFTATDKIGMAKAYGMWAPLNIIVAIIWGIILHGEFLKMGSLNVMLAIGSVVFIIAGIIVIIISGGNDDVKRTKRDTIIGFAGAIGAGILWGTFFIPASYLGEEVTTWVTAFPQAVGMFAGSTVLALLSGEKPVLAKRSDYTKTLSSGLMWAVGLFAMLLMVAQIGTGKGFTIAQLGVIVNSLLGIYYFKDPAPKSKAATLTLIGIALATIGGIVLGNLK